MSNFFKAAMLPLQAFVFFAALCAVLPRVETQITQAARTNCTRPDAEDPDAEDLPCAGLEWQGCGNLACPVHQENGIPVLRCLNTTSLCDGMIDCPDFLQIDEGTDAVFVLNPSLECKEDTSMTCHNFIATQSCHIIIPPMHRQSTKLPRSCVSLSNRSWRPNKPDQDVRWGC